jgi:ferredoxin
MAYVVTEPCFGCKYTDCVVVCPADCFYEGEQMLYIHPEECIVCDACKPECPVEAIYQEEDVPEVWKDFIDLNREMAAKCPSIARSRSRAAGREGDGMLCKSSLPRSPDRALKTNRRPSRGRAWARGSGSCR